MSVRRLVPKHLRLKKLRTKRVFPAPQVIFNSNSIDFDGDFKFGAADLRALSKRHFTERISLGDGHCFFRCVHRFLRMAKLYTAQELEHFKRVRDRLDGTAGSFPEICYLRRVSQKFCSKIHIKKYGRDQPPSEDAMDYAAESQAYGLQQARLLEGTGGRGYADSPDYEACATVFNIVLCILQIDGKWQVFPDDCLENGFGDLPIMFAYNSGAIHFNSLFPNMEEVVKRKTEIEGIARRMAICKPTPHQACHIATYFFGRWSNPMTLDKDCSYIMNIFKVDLDTAIEMIYVRRMDLRYNTVQKCIADERQMMTAFSKEMFMKLLTYGDLKTNAGFKSASDLMLYLAEKNLYLNRRDSTQYTIDQVAKMYLNGD